MQADKFVAERKNGKHSCGASVPLLAIDKPHQTFLFQQLTGNLWFAQADKFVAARKNGKRGSPSSVLSLAGSPNDSYGSESSVPSSGRMASDAASVPGYAEVATTSNVCRCNMPDRRGYVCLYNQNVPHR